eukprot:g11583.t1
MLISSAAAFESNSAAENAYFGPLLGVTLHFSTYRHLAIVHKTQFSCVLNAISLFAHKSAQRKVAKAFRFHSREVHSGLKPRGVVIDTKAYQVVVMSCKTEGEPAHKKSKEKQSGSLSRFVCSVFFWSKL